MRHLISYAIVLAALAAIFGAAAAPALAADAGPEAASIEVEKAEAPTADTPLLDGAAWVWRTATGDAPGKVWLALGGLLILATASARKIPRVGDWLKATDVRSVLLTFGLAFAGAWGTALLASASFSAAGAQAAFAVGVAAAGGYAVLWKRLALPLLRRVPLVRDWLPQSPDEAKAA